MATGVDPETGQIDSPNAPGGAIGGGQGEGGGGITTTSPAEFSVLGLPPGLIDAINMADTLAQGYPGGAAQMGTPGSLDVDVGLDYMPTGFWDAIKAGWMNPNFNTGARTGIPGNWSDNADALNLWAQGVPDWAFGYIKNQYKKRQQALEAAQGDGGGQTTAPVPGGGAVFTTDPSINTPPAGGRPPFAPTPEPSADGGISMIPYNSTMTPPVPGRDTQTTFPNPNQPTLNPQPNPPTAPMPTGPSYNNPDDPWSFELPGGATGRHPVAPVDQWPGGGVGIFSPSGGDQWTQQGQGGIGMYDPGNQPGSSAGPTWITPGSSPRPSWQDNWQNPNNPNNPSNPSWADQFLPAWGQPSIVRYMNLARRLLGG